jgi:hypothetical protein
VTVPDELRRMRVQVLERFREWDRQAVPAWTYSLLIGRFFQCLSDGPEPRAVSLCDEGRALVRWVVQSAKRGAAGRTLTPAEVDEASRLVRWPWPEEVFPPNSGYQGLAGPPAYLGLGPPLYVGWLATALTDPRHAARQMVENLERSGLPWTGHQWKVNQVRPHSTLVGVAECVHPVRPVDIDSRWRTADVLGLAAGIREDRALDRLPLLADALMDAGCDDDFILSHCKSQGPHTPDCWVIGLFRPRRATPSRHPRVAQGMAAVARYAGPDHPNLVAFARTGVLRDEGHKAAALTELADLSGALAPLPEARPLARLLEILPSAPVGVRIHEPTGPNGGGHG